MVRERLEAQRTVFSGKALMTGICFSIGKLSNVKETEVAARLKH